MSFLTEVSSSDYSGGGSAGSGSQESNPPQYDYHLPHTKTIDLIGEEFAPRKDSPTITTGSSIAIVTSSGGLPVSSTLFLNSNNILTTLAPLSGSNSSSLLQAISGGQVVTLPNVVPSLAAAGHGPTVLAPGHHELLSSQGANDGPPAVITTLPFNAGGHGLSDVLQQPLSGGNNGSGGNNQHNPEENGVLLCNLDELSRYIPETFYSDFNISEPKLDYLDSSGTPSSVGGINKTVTCSSNNNMIQSLSCSSGGGPLCTSSIMVSSGGPILTTTTSSAQPIVSAPGCTLSNHFSSAPHGTPITIQLPTQPQPQQGVKTLTYVQNNVSKAGGSGGLNTSTLQPVKLTTGFAYTATGEKFSIQGLTDHHHHKQNSTVQVQVKPQTLQLAGLDPSKLAVLQELPDVSKVVIQDKASNLQSSNLNNLLEDMKGQSESGGLDDGGPVGYTTAIPVAVSSLNSGSKKPATVLMPNKRSRNIIFAGNTLPQGAIPIQINGLNALPISAVKSIPLSIGSLSAAPVVRKAGNKLDFVKSSANNVGSTTTVISSKQASSLKCPIITSSSASNQLYSTTVSAAAVANSGGSSSPHKAIGNNKTCTWVFENGEVCGKTFSKSYNLVVHMRMHEDVRPFCCSLCDQTFRQKAHLQRHETTHGIGVKVSRNSSSNLKKRKKKSSIVLPNNNVNTNTTNNQGHSASLQKRLSRVDEKFSLKSSDLVKNTHQASTKFSSAEIDEAIKAAVEGSNLGGSGGGLLSLKREPSDSDDAPSSKMPHMSVKVEPAQEVSPGSVIVKSSSHLNNSSSNNNSSVTSSPPSSSSNAITAQFVQHPGSTTIVIDNLEDHSPEIQKEILNALLADHASGTSLFTIQPANNQSGEKANEVVVEDQGNPPQNYPPVTVQEFLQENSNNGGGSASHILVENSSAE